MNNILLAAVSDGSDKNVVLETVGEKLSYGGQMLVVGMLTVFAVLAIIWLSLVIFKFFCSDLPNMKKGGSKEERKPKEKKEKKPKKKEKEDLPTETGFIPAASADTALIAAITAAITEERKKAGCIGGFRVVSFRRK